MSDVVEATVAGHVQTRAQRLLALAYDCVREVTAEQKKVQEIYGTIAHDFGVVVRTTGLAQAVLFAQAKASGPVPRATAYELLLRHLAAVLGRPADQLMHSISTEDANSYLLDTQLVLEAWVYVRRFTISVLKVEVTQRTDDVG